MNCKLEKIKFRKWLWQVDTLLQPSSLARLCLSKLMDWDLQPTCRRSQVSIQTKSTLIPTVYNFNRSTLWESHGLSGTIDTCRWLCSKRMRTTRQSSTKRCQADWSSLGATKVRRAQAETCHSLVSWTLQDGVAVKCMITRWLSAFLSRRT